MTSHLGALHTVLSPGHEGRHRWANSASEKSYSSAKCPHEPHHLRGHGCPADPPPPCSSSWQVSDKCWALLLSMLAADPAARPSLARIAANPWVRNGAPPALLRLNDDLLSKARSTLAGAGSGFLSLAKGQVLQSGSARGSMSV